MEPVLKSGFVDFVINGSGDKVFPQLVDAMVQGTSYYDIKSLAFMEGDTLVKTPKEPLLKYDSLPELPYEKLHGFYPLSSYLGRSYLGQRTIAYHSSFGCPFKCSFCAVVPIYEARWNGKSAEKIFKDILYLKENFGGDSNELHDNNFFVSEKRTVEFARLIKGHSITWWGEARIDTLDR